MCYLLVLGFVRPKAALRVCPRGCGWLASFFCLPSVVELVLVGSLHITSHPTPLLPLVALPMKVLPAHRLLHLPPPQSPLWLRPHPYPLTRITIIINVMWVVYLQLLQCHPTTGGRQPVANRTDHHWFPHVMYFKWTRRVRKRQRHNIWQPVVLRSTIASAHLHCIILRISEFHPLFHPYPHSSPPLRTSRAPISTICSFLIYPHMPCSCRTVHRSSAALAFQSSG